MGIFDAFRRKPPVKIEASEQADKQKKYAVGAMEDVSDVKQFQAFDASNMTVNGDLSGYDYQAILRDKQENIDKLYSLADYYTDADEIIHGIIKHIYVPYSASSKWQLLNVKQKTRQIYEEKYAQIHLEEKIKSIMLQYWKYGNVVLYYNNGYLQTLPIHKCKFGNVALNGDPIVEYNCLSIQQEFMIKGYTVKENWIKDNKLETVFKGYPKEIVSALNSGYQYAQLDPKNTFVLQGDKEDWQKYAVPFIAACLPHLAKKNLISSYEDAILNIGMRPIIHVAYGDKNNKNAELMIDKGQLSDVNRIFKKAMNGFPLAVTNAWVEAKVIQPDTSDLFQWKKYDDCNTAILSAGGISGILVTGVSNDGSTFASAQTSMNTAAVRIEAARDEFCKVMTRVNKRILEDIAGERSYNLKDAPVFTFLPIDMSGQKALRDACLELWKMGVVSTKTMMDTQGYAIEHESELRKKEASDGTDETLMNRDMQLTQKAAASQQNENTNAGRPKMDDSERTSDPQAAIRGKQPKPSNPEGSMEEEA